jgi:hypothetical protein
MRFKTASQTFVVGQRCGDRLHADDSSLPATANDAYLGLAGEVVPAIESNIVSRLPAS